MKLPPGRGALEEEFICAGGFLIGEIGQMQLIIAEKPDQGAKLAAPWKHRKMPGYLEIAPNGMFPSGALITWAVGHVCELVPPEHYDARYKRWVLGDLPILPEKFIHQVSKSKQKQFSIIRNLARRSDVLEIIHAGDAGREGEYIVRIAVQLAGVHTKPMKRLWISSLTPRAVEEGFRNLKSEADTRALYYEAVSRSCADWLVGMNGSRVYTLLFKARGVKEVFSTGRVQTPTLALIVAREKEISSFKPEPFWEVRATFKMGDAAEAYEGTYFRYRTASAEEGERTTRLQSEQEAIELAQQCAAGESARVQHVETERKTFQPPLLFNLSSLQAVANQLYKFSPSHTLATLQQLYLDGYVSYPRSDATVVTPDEAKQFPSILRQLSRQHSFASSFPLPHASIANNRRYVNASKVSDHYAIIPTEVVPDVHKLKADQRKLYELVAMRLIAAHYDAAVVDYAQLVTGVGTLPHLFMTKGKTVVEEGWHKVIKVGKEDEEDVKLPAVREGEQGAVEQIEIRVGKTQPPKRYTEGQLITLMKTAGKQIGDAELEKVLAQTEGLGTEATRAGIIAVLKDRTYIEVRKNMVFATPKGIMLIEALGDSVLASAAMTARWEQKLRAVGQGDESPVTFMQEARELTAELVRSALEQARTWNVTKAPAAATKLLGACPICSGEVALDGAAQRYRCMSKSRCPFSVSQRIMGKTLTETQVQRLLAQGTTALIRGFSKDGRKFDARIVWDAANQKVRFSFVDPNK